MKGNLEIKNVTKLYKDFKAVDQVNLTVNQGEFFTILGPSGSGKTTLLKLIAGFEELNSGTIKLKDESIASKKPYERNIGMVFQNYALFPHMTVFENIAYPLRRRKIKKKKVEEKVREVLRIVHLEDYIDHYPSQLSGGQQQRVALARAIVFSPPLLLLDEPLGALDKKLRQQMQIEIKSIQENLGITTISVTHDQEEALTMSDRICVMNEGGVEQIDTPENLYKYPKNQFVAEFIGEINLIKGEVVETDKHTAKVKLLNREHVVVNNKGTASNHEHVFVVLRPENIQLVTEEKKFANTIRAKVLSIIYLGDAIKVELKTKSDEDLIAKLPPSTRSLVIGEEVNFGWNPSEATIIPNESLQDLNADMITHASSS